MPWPGCPEGTLAGSNPDPIPGQKNDMKNVIFFDTEVPKKKCKKMHFFGPQIGVRLGRVGAPLGDPFRAPQGTPPWGTTPIRAPGPGRGSPPGDRSGPGPPGGPVRDRSGRPGGHPSLGVVNLRKFLHHIFLH